jgi:sulfur carrier protein ThiS
MSGLVLMVRKRFFSAVLWQLLFIIAVIAILVEHQMTVAAMMKPIRFVAMDSRSTFYLSNVGNFEEAKEIHAELAKMAAETIFDRSPDGFDDLERLDRLFNPSTTERLKREAARDADIFRTQQIHQKFEAGMIRELRVDSNTALVSVEGQVLRTGTFNERIVNDAKKVTVFLKLALNDDLVRNGRYPLVVLNYDLRYL